MKRHEWSFSRNKRDMTHIKSIFFMLINRVLNFDWKIWFFDIDKIRMMNDQGQNTFSRFTIGWENLDWNFSNIWCFIITVKTILLYVTSNLSIRYQLESLLNQDI